jgi:hypothetical protein
MADNTSLTAAVDAAAAEITGKPVPAAEVAETEPEVIEGEEPDETPEVPEGSDELTEAQIIESKNLYKALSGPQANAIIAALAAQAGLLPKVTDAPATRTETAAARREIKDIVKEALGPEYAFLQDKIGKIFDEVTAQQNAENETRFAEIQQSNVERQVVTAYEKLAVETKGVSKQLETRMAQLSEEMPIGNMNVETYMRRLYSVASGERKSSPQKVADQIRRNASDAPARLRASVGPTGQVVEIPTKKMNLNESVAWALDQVNKGKK